MAVIYEYPGLVGVPCLPFIRTRILYGDVESQAVDEIRWDGTTSLLRVVWHEALTPAQKVLLDNLVTLSIGKTQISKPREEIVNEIFWAARTDPAQLVRLLDAFDAVPSMALALDNYNYPLARIRVVKCYDDGLITEADRDLLLSKIPENEFELE
jgi:hypothetical protein